MPNLSLPFVLLLVAMLSSGSEGEKMCTEGLGLCGAGGKEKCDEQCKARHVGQESEGACDYRISPSLCMCYYDCTPPPGPPPRKQCTAGLGMCSLGCGDKCCDEQCKSKYREGQGFCNQLGNLFFCQCDYDCTPPSST